MPRTYLAAGLLCLLQLSAAPARADTWDINLARLCQVQAGTATYDCGGGFTEAFAKAHPDYRIVADNAAFRALMSELGVVFAPKFLSPSDTRGYSGFHLATEFGWTMVNPKRTVKDQDTTGNPDYYWRAAESVSSRAFADPSSRDAGRLENELPPGFAPTVTLMASKGFWLPVPSFEIGIGGKHLIGSQMWAPTVTGKLAVHEGFHGWPLPSLAVRGSGARVIGTPGFNLTVVGLDFSASKHIGVASTFNLTPYAGYQLLWIVADSEVIDATPGIDAVSITAKEVNKNPDDLSQCNARAIKDCAGYFTFANQSNITRHRVFMGLRANFYVASLLLEYSYFASGAKSDEIARKASSGLAETLIIPDASGTQHNISFALAVDY